MSVMWKASSPEQRGARRFLDRGEEPVVHGVGRQPVEHPSQPLDVVHLDLAHRQRAVTDAQRLQFVHRVPRSIKHVEVACA